jgi:hypothetical protein
MSQLSMFDRKVLGYCGVDAAAVADAERVTLDAVREVRARHGRRPSDGEPVSVHREQADEHARRARDLHRAGMGEDSQAAWNEANFQASQAVLDELAAIAKLMRDNRNPSL